MIQVSQPVFAGNERLYLDEVMFSGRISAGPFVERFEAAVAVSAGAVHAVACSSGTAALHLALLACGLRPGDMVLVPATTYIATANAVMYCGGTPVILDVDPETWMPRPEDLRQAAKSLKIKGIITVDLYGKRCPIPEDLPENIWVVADSCEAHGLRLDARATAAVFSYYGNKIVTCGEGGAVVTNRPEIEARARYFRGQAQTAERYVHGDIGYNYRMTEMQAAIGCAQMEQLAGALLARRNLRIRYDTQLPRDFATQEHKPGDVDWVMPVMFGDSRRAAGIFEAAGIETRPVFPPVGHQAPYSYNGLALWQTPIAEMLHKHGLILPLHCGMSNADVDRISEVADGILKVAA